MKIVIGDMWAEEDFGPRDKIILVTTNSVINAKGAVVMGRGAALEAARRYPGIPFDLADQVKRIGSTYGIILLPPFANSISIGAFQVKHDWRESAKLPLIQFATTQLTTIASILYWRKFILNYPGIGNGKLTENEVLPIIKDLPDNVVVYKKT